MNHFSTWRIYHWSMKKYLLAISIATVVMETNSFIRIMQPISLNYPWQNGVKQIQSAEQKLSQSYILCSIPKDKYLSSRVTMHRKIFFYYFSLHFSYTCWVDVIYLTCLTIPKSPLKINKGEHKKIFCCPSKVFKNTSWPIDIYLEFFMAPAKTFRPPLLYTWCTAPYLEE